LNKYKKQFKSSIQKNELSQEANASVKLPNQNRKAAKKSALSFLLNKDDTRNVFMIDNVLLYKDQDIFAFAKAIRENKAGTTINLIAAGTNESDSIAFSIDGILHKYRYSGGYRSGSKAPSDVHDISLFDKFKLLQF